MLLHCLGIASLVLLLLLGLCAFTACVMAGRLDRQRERRGPQPLTELPDGSIAYQSRSA
jgi:hypothetical protein